MPHWDVLYYGIGHDPDSILPFKDPVLYSKNAFSTRGICVAFAHIKRRDDPIVFTGLQAHMIKAIEMCIDEILPTKAEYFGEKKELFQNKIKKDGNWNSDAEIFFAAIDVLQKVRNKMTHPSDSTKLQRNIKMLAQQFVYFCNTAEKYGCKVTPDFISSFTEADLHKHIKWQNSIGRAAVEWIYSYKKATMGI